MTQQYLRKSSIVLGPTSGGSGVDVSSLRCTFHVRRGDNQTPNTVDLRVYNAASSTLSQVQPEFSQVVIQAGYEGSYGLIFRGTVKQVRQGREDALNTYVDVTAADGDEAYNFAPISLSLAKGSSRKDSAEAIISTLVQAAGLEAPTNLPTLSTNGRVRGCVHFGLARNEMRKFCMANDLAWSIQDGTLALIPLTGYLPGEVPVISPTTGLIGVPEQTANGIEMRVLLNPNIKIGQLVKLDQSVVNQLRAGLDVNSANDFVRISPQIKTSADGTYYVMYATHSGDTRGQDWYTHMVCLATDASIQAQPPVQHAIPEGAIKLYP